MAGFTMDASDALRLMAELQAKHTQLVADAKRETSAAGLGMQTMARQMARSRSFPRLAGSIYTKTRQFTSGIEVTIEAKDPFGEIREFGAARTGPRPFMLPALERGLPIWEAKLAAALGRTL